MKNLFQVFLFGAFCILMVTACNKEEMSDLTVETDLMESTDQIQFMPTAEPALPDLVIRNVSSNLVVGSGPCPGPDKADGTCASGATFVQLTATLRNRTAIAIPAGTQIDVKWEEVGGNTITAIYTNGLPGNSSITINSPFYSLDCPQGQPPFALITRQFFAQADPNNTIAEFRENNNFSTRYFVCDDE